jgi:hypothetical protein
MIPRRADNMTVKTDCSFFAEDVGKNLYRKKTYFTVMIEQEVIAKDKDEADTLFLDHGGIKYGDLRSIVDDGNGVETTIVDADYDRSDSTEYVGKVVYEDTEYAKEDGDVEIDQYVDENEKVEA